MKWTLSRDSETSPGVENSDRVKVVEHSALVAAEREREEWRHSSNLLEQKCRELQASIIDMRETVAARERERDEAKQALADNTCGYCDFDRSLSKERDRYRAALERLSTGDQFSVSACAKIARDALSGDKK